MNTRLVVLIALAALTVFCLAAFGWDLSGFGYSDGS